MDSKAAGFDAHQAAPAPIHEALSTSTRSPSTPASQRRRCDARSKAARGRTAVNPPSRSAELRNCSAVRRSSNDAASSSTSTRSRRSAHSAMRARYCRRGASRAGSTNTPSHWLGIPRKAAGTQVVVTKAEPAGDGRAAPPRYGAGQHHAADTISRSSPRPCGDDGAAGLAHPPNPAAAAARPHPGVDEDDAPPVRRKFWQGG